MGSGFEHGELKIETGISAAFLRYPVGKRLVVDVVEVALDAVNELHGLLLEWSRGIKIALQLALAFNSGNDGGLLWGQTRVITQNFGGDFLDLSYSTLQGVGLTLVTAQSETFA